MSKKKNELVLSNDVIEFQPDAIELANRKLPWWASAGVLWLFPAVAVAAPLLFFRRSYHRCGGHRRMVCLLLLSGLVVLPSCAGAQNGQTNTRPPEISPMDSQKNRKKRKSRQSRTEESC